MDSSAQRDHILPMPERPVGCCPAQAEADAEYQRHQDQVEGSFLAYQDRAQQACDALAGVLAALEYQLPPSIWNDTTQQAVLRAREVLAL